MITPNVAGPGGWGGCGPISLTGVLLSTSLPYRSIYLIRNGRFIEQPCTHAATS